MPALGLPRRASGLRTTLLQQAAGVGGASPAPLRPQPGSPVYSSKCEDCVCTNRTDSSSQLNVISCTHVHCEDTCSPVSAPADGPRPAPGSSPARADLSVRVPQGFELVDVPGQCCGKCQQTHCIVKRPGAETIILKVRGEPRRLAAPRPASPHGRGTGPARSQRRGLGPLLCPLLGWARLRKGPGAAMTGTTD